LLTYNKLLVIVDWVSETTAGNLIKRCLKCCKWQSASGSDRCGKHSVEQCIMMFAYVCVYVCM